VKDDEKPEYSKQIWSKISGDSRIGPHNIDLLMSRLKG
jgi:hypothetical protein